MKFDVILSNPPYNRGLHEKFEIKYFDICKGLIIWISPLSFLLRKQKNKEITSKLNMFNVEIEQVNGNEFFDSVFGGILGIVSIDMESSKRNILFNNKNYNKCDEISTYSNDELLMQFKDIVEPLYRERNIESIISLDHKLLPASGVNRLFEPLPNPEWWCLGILIVRGHRDNTSKEVKDDFYTVISNNPEFIRQKIGRYKDLHEEEKPDRSIENNQKFNFNLYIHADTEQEINNIVNYLKTDFCRACIMLHKNSIILVNGSLSSIPMFDFSESVFARTPSEIDDYLFANYNISDEIRLYIKKLLPDYYGIRH